MKKKFISCFLLLLIGIILTSCGLSKEVVISFNPYKKQYTQSELALISNDSFVSLNRINFPNLNKETYNVKKEYIDSILNFSFDIYKRIDKTKNMFFSPMGLYSVLSIVSLACNIPEINNVFDQVLYQTKEERNNNYADFYKSNYFVNEDGTVQFYNGVFSTNKYEANHDFISLLTKYYCEAYSMNFYNDQDVNKMLEWIDKRVQSEKFLNKKDLEIDETTAMFIINTLYFNNKWANSFATSKTKEGPFYLNNNEQIQTNYMHHSYLGLAYDYGTYLSVYDYYKNGYSVQYLISKDHKDNIFELLGDYNFLIEDENKRILSSENEDYLIINLDVPKFKNECLINFNDILIELGLDIIFDENSHSLDGAFSNLPIDYSTYLSYVKQKNIVSFSEDGTEIKSTTYAMVGNMSSAPIYRDTINVTLDNPFIYIIYDENHIPLYIGNLNNPNE